MIMDRIALILAIIGGINWGSVGLFRFDMSMSKMIPTEDINQIPVDFDYVAAHKAEMQEHFKEIAIKYAE